MYSPIPGLILNQHCDAFFDEVLSFAEVLGLPENRTLPRLHFEATLQYHFSEIVNFSSVWGLRHYRNCLQSHLWVRSEPTLYLLSIPLLILLNFWGLRDNRNNLLSHS